MSKCPYSGKECHKPKAYKVVDIAINEVTQFKLCEDCIQDFVKLPPQSSKKTTPNKNIEDMNAIELIDVFVEFWLPKEIYVQLHEQKAAASAKNNACPNCKLTLEDLIKNSRLGCATCWEFFGDKLTDALRVAHGDIHHVGKVPKNWLKQQKEKRYSVDGAKKRLVDLQEKIQKVISTEEYEEAAKIQKEINSWEQYIKNLSLFKEKIQKATDLGKLAYAKELIALCGQYKEKFKNQTFNSPY